MTEPLGPCPDDFHQPDRGPVPGYTYGHRGPGGCRTYPCPCWSNDHHATRILFLLAIAAAWPELTEERP